MQATSAGAKDQEAENFLEKKFKGDAAFSYDEAVQNAIAALQSVLSEDFKAKEIEVGFSFTLNRTFGGKNTVGWVSPLHYGGKMGARSGKGSPASPLDSLEKFRMGNPPPAGGAGWSPELSA